MSNGSSAPDGGGWSSPQDPSRGDAMSGPAPPAPGRRSEPREVPGGRREVAFGPDVSWPNGFRQLDPESRHLLESGYGRGVDPGYGRGVDPGYGTGVDPGYGTGGRGPGYRDPAA